MYSFSSQIPTLYIRYHILRIRVHNVSYSPHMPGLVNVVKGCLIVMIFLPMTTGYTNTLITWNIQSGDIYNLQFTLIK